MDGERACIESVKQALKGCGQRIVDVETGSLIWHSDLLIVLEVAERNLAHQAGDRAARYKAEP